VSARLNDLEKLPDQQLKLAATISDKHVPFGGSWASTNMGWLKSFFAGL